MFKQLEPASADDFGRIEQAFGTGPNFTITIVSGFTRLRQIFWTYVTTGGKKARYCVVPGNTNCSSVNDNLFLDGNHRFSELPWA